MVATQVGHSVNVLWPDVRHTFFQEQRTSLRSRSGSNVAGGERAVSLINRMFGIERVLLTIAGRHYV